MPHTKEKPCQSDPFDNPLKVSLTNFMRGTGGGSEILVGCKCQTEIFDHQFRKPEKTQFGHCSIFFLLCIIDILGFARTFAATIFYVT